MRSARAIDRVEVSERETTAALEGQRRLVREVHHRVKNNLQVVASLLNIHGRSAETSRRARRLCRHQPARRRLVHRPPQPFCRDGGESRHLAAAAGDRARRRASRRRPRGGARAARSISTWTALYTTQDAAVAVAFLITEIIEFAMLNAPEEPIELSLRRTSELTARLSLGSPILVPEEEGEPGKVAVRADRRGPRQAAPLAARPKAWSLRRRFARISRRLMNRATIVTAPSKKI